jgi:hypothetical protein
LTNNITPALGPLGYFGRHIWEVKLKNITKFALQVSKSEKRSKHPSFSELMESSCQTMLASINLWAASVFFVKLSLFLFYLRLFKPNKHTRWLNYGGIAACGMFYSITIIINSVLSSPTAGQPDNWTSWLLRTQQSELHEKKLALAQSIFGTISDVYLLMIPIQTIFQLHLSTERKLGISAIFMIGIL